jgi:hypothetical protein
MPQRDEAAVLVVPGETEEGKPFMFRFLEQVELDDPTHMSGMETEKTTTDGTGRETGWDSD